MAPIFSTFLSSQSPSCSTPVCVPNRRRFRWRSVIDLKSRRFRFAIWASKFPKALATGEESALMRASPHFDSCETQTLWLVVPWALSSQGNLNGSRQMVRKKCENGRQRTVRNRQPKSAKTSKKVQKRSKTSENRRKHAENDRGAFCRPFFGHIPVAV